MILPELAYDSRILERRLRLGVCQWWRGLCATRVGNDMFLPVNFEGIGKLEEEEDSPFRLWASCISGDGSVVGNEDDCATGE